MLRSMPIASIRAPSVPAARGIAAAGPISLWLALALFFLPFPLLMWLLMSAHPFAQGQGQIIIPLVFGGIQTFGIWLLITYLRKTHDLAETNHALTVGVHKLAESIQQSTALLQTVVAQQQTEQDGSQRERQAQYDWQSQQAAQYQQMAQSIQATQTQFVATLASQMQEMQQAMSQRERQAQRDWEAQQATQYQQWAQNAQKIQTQFIGTVVSQMQEMQQAITALITGQDEVTRGLAVWLAKTHDPAQWTPAAAAARLHKLVRTLTTQWQQWEARSATPGLAPLNYPDSKFRLWINEIGDLALYVPISNANSERLEQVATQLQTLFNQHESSSTQTKESAEQVRQLLDELSKTVEQVPVSAEQFLL